MTTDPKDNLSRQPSAPRVNVFSRLPLLGQLMIALRDAAVVLERIGLVVGYSSQMKRLAASFSVSSDCRRCDRICWL